MKAIPRSHIALFFALAAGGCAIDLATKRWIFDRLGMPGIMPPEWLIPNVFSFTTSLNQGALFGIGQGQVALFAALSVVALLGILVWLFVAGAARDRLLTIALGAVCAGILGNLYDRMGFAGLQWNGQTVYAVRDWLHFQIEGLIDWPIFNIADSLLVCGAGLLVWQAFRAEPVTRPCPATDATAASPSPEATGHDAVSPRHSA
ncbi:MAG TPA: signal peptidase II [Pirellulales bacterium]|nr:signal peptidase II [Pirellulales bacterium]